MAFGKKKDMVDIRDIPKRNINLPNGKDFVAKDGYGFVDLTRKPKSVSVGQTKKLETTQANSSPSAFSFFDSSPSFQQTAPSSNDETKELLRKLSTQISDLDSKIYQLEQRMELVEKKLGVGDSSSSSIGW